MAILRRPRRKPTPLEEIEEIKAVKIWEVDTPEKLTRFEKFKAARGKDPSPSSYQEYFAYLAAGEPEDFRIKTLVAPSPRAVDRWVESDPTQKWWQIWKRRSRLVKADDPFELLALTEELYQASQGFKPSDEQLRYILTGRTMPGLENIPGREKRYEHLVTTWAEFKSGEVRAQLEHPTQEQRMESWRRAGSPRKYSQKTFRDELGKLIGVSTFTPEEIEEMGAFKPSEAQKVWAFRETRKMLPKKQLRIWAQEHAAELASKEELEEELSEELASLRTIRIRKGKDIPAALRIGGIDKLMARRRELEDMLGVGVDR